MLESYRESLGKLKEALAENTNKTSAETSTKSENEKPERSGKRKHMKERNTKFIKRFKQVAD